jgi:hypothetical protein
MRVQSMPLAAVVASCAIVVACGGGGSTGPSGPPILLDINGATAPSGPIGGTVIIEGSNFGATQGAGQVLFSNGSGGTLAATIGAASDWSDVFIVTTVPAGAATGAVKVQTSGGTSDTVHFTLTQNAPFSPSTITWSATTPLPVPLSGHAAAFGTLSGASPARIVWVSGGADSTYAPRSEVYYAAVDSSGKLGAWSTGAALPAARAFHAMVVATPLNSRVSGPGYLYVLGGATDAAGASVNTVYKGTLDATGNVTGWTAVTALPAALHSLGAVVFLGNIYIAAGSAAGNAPVATIYRASISSAGDLGSWQALASLPTARSYAEFVQFGGYLYAFGGDSGTVTPNDSNFTINTTKLSSVVYAKVDLRSRNLTAAGWASNASSMGKVFSKQTDVVAGGNVLNTGGLYAGASTGSSEESYAQLNGDGSVASFNGATGSHTIASAGGKNLFNHAAIAYIDAAGTAHVMVLGGDDVNAPGKKRAEVWYY